MKHLGRIALGGIGVGIVSGGLAMALGADDFRALAHNGFGDWSGFHDEGCRGYQAEIGGPEQRLAWDGGDNVVIALRAQVTYRAGEGTEVIVKGAPKDVARVRVQNGRIERCGHGRSGRIEVILPGHEFRHLTLAGSGDVTMEKMAQSDLNLTIAGSGTIQAKGSVERVSITIAGSGDALLGDVAMKRLDVKIAGSGDTEASPQDDADVTIMGSGDVKLLTRPAHLTTNIMGSGRVVQPEPGLAKSSAT